MSKVNKHGKQTSAANGFGAGDALVGKEYRGKPIISATRKYMTTADGKFERKGQYVQHEPIEWIGDWDDTETEGDRL